MFTGVGIFPDIDLAFNFGLILTALIAMGITSPEFNLKPKKETPYGTPNRIEE